TVAITVTITVAVAIGGPGLGAERTALALARARLAGHRGGFAVLRSVDAELGGQLATEQQREKHERSRVDRCARGRGHRAIVARICRSISKIKRRIGELAGKGSTCRVSDAQSPTARRWPRQRPDQFPVW